MNRVTIGELIEDVVPFTEESDKIIPIAIVPRKILEDVLELCEVVVGAGTYNFSNAPYTEGRYDMAYSVKTLIERELKDFEEGTHDSNNQ